MNIQVVANPAKRDCFQILVDGEVWREVHPAIFGRRLRFSEEIQSMAQLQEAYAEKEYNGAKRYALWRLARSAQSSMALCKSLQERHVSEAIQQKVMAFLTTAGLIDDEDYVQRFVQCERARGRGPAAIRAKLKVKGIPADMIGAALQPLDVEEEQQALARLLETRYRRYDMQDVKQRHKVIASLMRRGFSFDAIRSAIAK